MWLTKLFASVMVVLTGLLPSSCTAAKKSAGKIPAPPVTASVESLTNKNLGELELTNHYETCVNLGAGKSCTFRPILLDHHTLQLTLAFESKNAGGGVKDLSVIQVLTKNGEPFVVGFGDMNLTLTPKLDAE